MEMTNTSAVRTASKDILARLLAAENLTVVHDSSAQTASMDTKNRVLTLPVWQDMTGSVYDMLVGHEVSHALYTPSEEWREFSERVGGNSHYNVATMYLNIVEDARIERMIKDKFPGLRRDFAAAYRRLHSQDLFGLADVEDINALGFIDRVNLHFKIGFIEPIAFSAAEQVWVDRIEDAKTFEEVCEIAEALYNMAPKEAPETGESEAGQEDSPETGDDTVAAAGEDTDGPNGNGVPSPAGDDGEAEDGEEGTAGAGGDEEAEDGDETGAAAGGDDSGESMEDDTDDGESAEGEEKAGEGEGDGEPDTTNEGSGPAAPHTYEAEEAGKNGMVDQGAPEYVYADFPKANLDNIIHDYKNVIADFAEIDTNEAEIAFNAFERESRPVINAMVQAFNMKKAADEHKRTSEGTTGVLDTVRMVNYKFSDDIFSRYNVVADGKNHGIVALLDWSGSMCDCIEETVQQLQQLVLFCKKVNVPFEVYAFTSNHFATEHLDRFDDTTKDAWKAASSFDIDPEDYRGPSNFTLLNLASSRMNAREYKRGMVILQQLARSQSYNTYAAIPRNYGLGGTPLNEAMAAMLDIVPAFKKQTGVQIVNLSVLTDGAGGRIFPGLTYNSVGIYRDPKTNREYTLGGRRGDDEMSAFIDAINDRCDARTVGFYLVTKFRDAQYANIWTEAQQRDWDNVEKEFKKTGVAFAGASSYDEYFVIKSNQKVDNAGIEDLDADASFTKLRNAFAKSGKNKRVSRTILNRFVDIIAN
tara:strand:+ start:5640 stop:7907 length:2268 start_codon:yes stop_codon:yes gene_type:complete